MNSRHGGLQGVVEATLKDTENGFFSQFREGLNLVWQSYVKCVTNIRHYDKPLAQTLEKHPDCKELMAFEGVSVINAI